MKWLMIAWAVGTNTFKEAVRSRVIHAVLGIAACSVLASVAVAKMSLENDARVIRDLGGSMISLTLVSVAILAGVTFLHKDIGRKTIYTVVTKPVARSSFLIGKYIGLLLVLAASEAVLGGVWMLTMLVRGDEFGQIVFQSLWLSYLEAAIVAAFAILMSSFSTPILSGLITFGFFVLGRWREELVRFGKVYKGGLQSLFEVLAVPLPNLPLFRTDLQLAYLVPLRWDYVAYTTGYALVVIAGLLTVSSVIFSRRDFV